MEEALLVAFVVIILLPWFGGLFLTVVNFWYARGTIAYQSDRIRQLKTENEALRQERTQLEHENQRVNLTLQTTLVENAMLSARGDVKTDE